MKINDVRIYTIKVYGQVEEGDINRDSPVQFRIGQVEETNTSITLQTDQSGVIGLIRHLHRMGLVLLSITSSVANLADHGAEITCAKQ